MDFAESDRLRVLARNRIPAGCHTYSKGDDQFPSVSPAFIVRGLGCRVWDADGNEFLDWGMGLRSVVLGHAFEPVLRAVRAQLDLGVNFTRPSPVELEAAEELASLIPCAEMIKFAKNGSDVTSAAVKLARAYTGRDLVVRCQDHPFFAVNDWFIGDTVCDAGVPAATKALTKRFRYNDLQSLVSVLDEFSGQVACVIMEPAATVEPAAGFLEGVRALTGKSGCVLIFDEVITGFRWHQKGAQWLYRVTPDLATFGKALANGFSVSALTGRRELMELGGLEHRRPRVFLLSTTNGGETHSLAAARETLKHLADGQVTKHLWEIGASLKTGFNAAAAELGLADRVSMAGFPCSPYHVFVDGAGRVDYALRTLYLQEMLSRGILIPYIAPSLSHAESDVARTVEASREALRVLRTAVDRGSTEGLLNGAAVKPVFRRFN